MFDFRRDHDRSWRNRTDRSKQTSWNEQLDLETSVKKNAKTSPVVSGCDYSNTVYRFTDSDSFGEKLDESRARIKWTRGRQQVKKREKRARLNEWVSVAATGDARLTGPVDRKWLEVTRWRWWSHLNQFKLNRRTTSTVDSKLTWRKLHNIHYWMIIVVYCNRNVIQRLRKFLL